MQPENLEPATRPLGGDAEADSPDAPTKREAARRGVQLPEQESGSSFLHSVLLRATRTYPEVFTEADFPTTPGQFKHSFCEDLVRFEAARASSVRRVEIARSIVETTQRGLRFVDDAGRTSALGEHLRTAHAPAKLHSHVFEGQGRLVPRVVWEGREYSGRQLLELIERWENDYLMSLPAARGLRWITAAALDPSQGVDLHGQRFVLLGAGAELAPTRLLLEAGAEVLWVDLREPPASLLQDRRLRGTLHHVPGGSDLLRQPGVVRATIEAFTRRQPFHLWLYAYAGGASQEWRLTATMNAIVASFAPERLRSVATLISPTSPVAVGEEEQAAADERGRTLPTWRRALGRAGVLGEGQHRQGDQVIPCSLVAAQGASYQAAQYVGKLLSSEVHALLGSQPQRGVHPITVSANVAPITATRSLTLPVFEAAFIGAKLFQIMVAKPETTRELSGLLSLHDVLNQAAPGHALRPYRDQDGRARALFSQQIHGGVYTQPQALQGCITVAALYGASRKPSLLAGMLKG